MDHLQNVIATLSGKTADSDWATDEAELIISNDEGLYDLALELIQRFDNRSELASALEEEIKPIFLGMEYFENEKVENIDWRALAGELLGW